MNVNATRIAAALAAAGLAGTLGAAPAFAAPAAEQECSGTVTWAISDSFIDYSRNEQFHNTLTTDGVKVTEIVDPADDEEKIEVFVFDIDGPATKKASSNGKLTIVTKGSINSSGHEGIMDTTLKNVRFEVAEGGATGSVVLDADALEYRGQDPKVGKGAMLHVTNTTVASMKFDGAVDVNAKSIDATTKKVKFVGSNDAKVPFPTYNDGKNLAQATIKATGCAPVKEEKPAPSTPSSAAKPTTKPSTSATETSPQKPAPKPAPKPDNNGNKDGSAGTGSIIAVIAIVLAALAGLFQWAQSQGLIRLPH